MNWEIFNYRILIDYERAKKFVLEDKIPAPRFALLYITNFCNQNCRYCEYADENKIQSYMPTERVLRNIDELKELGVSAVEFCGGGEPLLHPDISKILSYCGQKKMAVGIFTNFSLANKKLLKIIVKNCSYLRVSLDTFDEVEYKSLRRSPLLGQVVSNLKELVRLKKEYHSPINIGVKMLLTKDNFVYAEAFIEKAVEIGVDNVQFKKVYLCPELEFDSKLIPELEIYLKRLKQAYKDIDIFYGFCNLKLKTACFMNINHIFIDAYGDIYLCCHYLDRKSEHRLGNVYKKTIASVWFSRKHREVIKNIDVKKCNKRDCRWIKYNNFMRPLVEDEGRPLDFI